MILKHTYRSMAAVAIISLLLSFIPLLHALAAETGVVNAQVILRKSESKTSQALQTLPAGEEITVLRSSADWYRVRYGSFTGYIIKDYVDLSDHSQIDQQKKIDALGNPPGALYIGDKGSDVKKLQNALKILGYYELRIDGIYGNGTTTAVALYQQYKDLDPDGIAGKQTIRAIFGRCADTADITLSGRNAQSEMDAPLTISNQNAVTGFSQIGAVPAASREGDSGDKVVKLQQALALLGYYQSTIDGDYGEETKNAVIQFQSNRKMTPDGIAGDSTIRVLFGGTGLPSSQSESTHYKTQVLDWFTDHVSSVIPKKAEFTIKDVRTGKTFAAVRWSGVNHLDAEPASFSDTAIFKSICKDWTWSRRPILILYKGKVYAASMNCMPHGTTTIDNGFNGHFCIHFKNSKTHETNRIDSQHQKAVEAASDATW